MEEQVRQIAIRIKELREILNISSRDAAKSCGLTTTEYNELESGQMDIPVGILHRLAKTLGVDVATFLSGQEPRMHSYTLTRKGQGVSVDRRKSYSYQALAANFINRKADPFLVKVEPKPDDEKVDYNSHPGQEFNLVLKGSMNFYLNEKEMVLFEGDSIYFDAGIPHGMKAARGRSCEFLAIIF